jgi:hypothetical protein
MSTEKEKIEFFMDELDTMIHRQVRENQVTTATAIGCLLFKILQIWKDAQDE